MMSKFYGVYHRVITYSYTEYYDYDPRKLLYVALCHSVSLAEYTKLQFFGIWQVSIGIILLKFCH
jgi:hypothetical protein